MQELEDKMLQCMYNSESKPKDEDSNGGFDFYEVQKVVTDKPSEISLFRFKSRDQEQIKGLLKFLNLIQLYHLMIGTRNWSKQEHYHLAYVPSMEEYIVTVNGQRKVTVNFGMKENVMLKLDNSQFSLINEMLTGKIHLGRLHNIIEREDDEQTVDAKAVNLHVGYMERVKLQTYLVTNPNWSDDKIELALDIIISNTTLLTLTQSNDFDADRYNLLDYKPEQCHARLWKYNRYKQVIEGLTDKPGVAHSEAVTVDQDQQKEQKDDAVKQIDIMITFP